MMRTYTRLNSDWQFIKEGKTEQIDLPHSWNAVDGQNGGDDYWRGTCIYRKRLQYTATPGKRLFLEFQGVSSEAEVLLDGAVIGSHEGGYSTFRFEITGLLHDGSLLEVRVTNTPNERVYPQKADFTFYGGIYRDVYLVETEMSHFALVPWGTTGIAVSVRMNGADAKATVHTETVGQCDFVRCRIGDLVQEVPAVGGTAEACFTIANARLWSGKEDPYLYHVTAELVADGIVRDQVDTDFGCRSYRVDPKQGFLLNGKAYPLRGVSRHQDRRGVGNALTREMMEEDMSILLELGATSVRLAHYQHDQYFYDLCDKYGIIVWAEIPYITKHMPAGNENTQSQMQELITQCRNHPSIVCWALSNEICVAGLTEDLLDNHRRLNALAKTLDPSRPTAIADAFMLEPESPINDIPDLLAYNLYFGWYSGELEDNDTFFDDFHAKYPNRPVGLAEYGADCRFDLESAKPERGDYSEQYQCLYHEHMLRMIEARPWLWCTYVWNLFDFGADGRAEADDPGVNHKGLVTFDRKVKKDAYYLYKAYWSSEPFVYLCGRRYVERAEDTTEIRVYSNQEQVFLYFDGTEAATQKGQHVFVFHLPITGTHHVEVRSGDCSDAITIRKVQEANPTYRLASSSVVNWFDNPGMDSVPGYFSVQDKMEDIRKDPTGRQLIDELLAKARASRGAVTKEVKRTESMERMLYRNTVVGLIRQAGGAITEEMALELNQKLRQIKKPVE